MGRRASAEIKMAIRDFVVLFCDSHVKTRKLISVISNIVRILFCRILNYTRYISYSTNKRIQDIYVNILRFFVMKSRTLTSHLW